MIPRTLTRKFSLEYNSDIEIISTSSEDSNANNTMMTKQSFRTWKHRWKNEEKNLKCQMIDNHPQNVQEQNIVEQRCDIVQIMLSL